MSNTLTIRIDDPLDKALSEYASRTGRPKSEVAREALRRQLAIARFDEVRRTLLPFAEARGYLIDDDVFRDVS